MAMNSPSTVFTCIHRNDRDFPPRSIECYNESDVLWKGRDDALSRFCRIFSHLFNSGMVHERHRNVDVQRHLQCRVSMPEPLHVLERKEKTKLHIKKIRLKRRIFFVTELNVESYRNY